jgi:hypothetical protein
MVRWWVLGIQWTVRWWVLGIQWLVRWWVLVHLRTV